MEKIKIAVKGNRAVLLGNVELIAGTIGQTCSFYFDEDWNSLDKTITYKLGANILGNYPIENNIVTIPKQVLAAAGLPLEIGITGRSTNGDKVIPTAWCLIGIIKKGANVNGENNFEDYYEIIYDGGGV